MYYFTIKELDKILSADTHIIEVSQENKWIVATLNNGIKIKFRNF